MILDLNQSKIMNVIDSKSLERDAGGKPVSTFPHPALASPKSKVSAVKGLDAINAAKNTTEANNVLMHAVTDHRLGLSSGTHPILTGHRHSR
jgi:hypothetical protein